MEGTELAYEACDLRLGVVVGICEVLASQDSDTMLMYIPLKAMYTLVDISRSFRTSEGLIPKAISMSQMRRAGAQL
jgi:hypothetical protein